MSHPKAPDQTFTSDWNQAVAWAQTQGIGPNVLTPVYQYDLGRLQNGEYPMSQAERVRAIKAAKNPNDVTPVPSDHPNPTSLFSNAVGDLRNIFTGLAPNHLIPNLFKMGEDAILHPSSWINPIEDVGKGLLSANFGEIQKGFNLASSSGSILSLVPGVSDVDELLQGQAGLDALAEHPISSFIDIAPFAPAGRIIKLAADESRMATIATKLGMPVDELYKASLPKMGSAWLLARDFTKSDQGVLVPRFPGSGKLTQVLTDPQGKPLTIGGALKMWGQTHTGLARTFSHVFSAAFDLRTYGTDAEVFTMVPLQKAEAALTDEQKSTVHSLVDKTDPRAQGKTFSEVMADDTIDPQVRDAYEKYTDALDMSESQAAAAGGLVQVEGPGHMNAKGEFVRDTDLFSVTGQPHPVVAVARELHDATTKAMKALGPEHALTKEVAELDKAGARLIGAMDQTRKKANEELVQGRISQPLEGKHEVHLDLSRQAALLTGDEGLIAKIADAGSTRDTAGRPKQQDFQSMVWLTSRAKKALDHDGYQAVDAARSESLTALKKQVDLLHDYAKARVARERTFLEELKRTGPRSVQGLVKEAIRVQRKFSKVWWENPPDRWRPVLYDKLVDQIIHRTDITDRVGALDERLHGYGWTEKQIAKVHSDPRVLAHAIWMESKAAATMPGAIRLLDDNDIRAIYDTAVDEVNKLREEGHEVAYVPVVTSLDIRERDPGHYGVGIAHKALIKDLSMTQRRTMDDFMPERHDLLAAVHLATKEAIQRDLTIEFVDTHLAPHALTSAEVYEWAMRGLPEMRQYDPAIRNAPDVLSEAMARQMGLVKWDPESKVGFSFPRYAKEGMYLPQGLANAVDKLLEKGQFPMDGAFDKATGLFRFSVLALSPRYTAHIVFGGTFLLALRSTPFVARYLPEALRMVKEKTMPQEIVQRATEFGVEPIKYRTVGLETHAHASGVQGGNMLIQAQIAKAGKRWQDSTAAEWAKAATQVNYRFTNYVVRVQRSLAYLDYMHKAERQKEFIDPDTGAKVPMTAARAKHEGIAHALKAMGDLKAMTPFERTWMTRLIPFYGWTRHILAYVGTYPVDHPFRAQFLTELANQQTDSVGKALDKRISFLFFLGSPDAQGNVSAVDLRFMDPLRDVANYATLGGLISALNPVLSAPLAAWDPQAIFGSTSIYPKVSYDSFYGIEVAGAQGSAWNAIEQVIPQTTALDAALNLSGEYRNLAHKNPNAFAKTIFEALSIPFAQVQKLNLKQLAAKGEIARYSVAKAAATTAFQTGDFSGLAGFASVPNPLNPDYEITPAQLEAVYAAAAAAYPGLPPQETVTPPPAPAGI